MQDFFSGILNSSFCGMVAFRQVSSGPGTVDFEIVAVNTAAEQLPGIEQSKAAGKRLSELSPPNLYGKIRDMLLNVQGKGEKQMEEIFYTWNESSKWLKMSAAALGEVYVIHFIDYTEEKQKEEQLRNSQAVLQESQKLALVGSYEWDAATNKLTWSEELYRIYGYDPSDFTLTYESSFRVVHPDDLELTSGVFATAREDFEYRFRFIRKDGSIGVATGKGKIVKDEHGNIVKVWGFTQDITERVKQEMFLLESQAIAQAGSWDWDISRNVVTGTPQTLAMFETHSGSWSLEYFISIVHPKDRDIVKSKIDEALRTKEPYSVEFCVILPSGRERHILTKGKVYCDKNDVPDRMIGTTLDITELHQVRRALQEYSSRLEEKIRLRTSDLVHANTELRKINDELEKFAHTISHDLRAPLNTITPLLDFIMEENGQCFNEDGKRMVDMIRERIEHMNALINSVLETARNKNRVMEQVDLNELLNKVIEYVNVPEHIHVLIQQKLPVVKYHRISLMQVLQNLLSNAVKYMDKEEGIISIKVKKLPDSYVLCVEDNGPGIPEENREKIFEPFHTGNEITTDESSGIGLSIVQKIVEEHGGRVWVDSDAGKGSSFCFTILG